MSDVPIPDFNPTHCYTETKIILQSEGRIYGEVVCLYPTAMDGGPDFSGKRSPQLQGRMLLVAVAVDGSQHQLPLSFNLPASDPIQAATMFKEYALAAVEEWRAAAFRQSLITPGGVIKQ